MKLQGWDLYIDDFPTWNPFRIFVWGWGLSWFVFKHGIPQKNAEFAGWLFQIFLFSTLPGEMIHFDEHIFQMGWFNHQLVWEPVNR